MKVLVVGNGGREHAICWKISKSSKVEKLYCAPGNPGINNVAECIDISPTDLISLKNFALNNTIELAHDNDDDLVAMHDNDDQMVGDDHFMLTNHNKMAAKLIALLDFWNFPEARFNHIVKWYNEAQQLNVTFHEHNKCVVL